MRAVLEVVHAEQRVGDGSTGVDHLHFCACEYPQEFQEVDVAPSDLLGWVGKWVGSFVGGLEFFEGCSVLERIIVLVLEGNQALVDVDGWNDDEKNAQDKTQSKADLLGNSPYSTIIVLYVEYYKKLSNG